MSQHYITCFHVDCDNDTDFKKGSVPDYKTVVCHECKHANDLEPTDGESYDKNGGIRPVPPGVSNTPNQHR